jgi:excisionase family DNA binding protein
MAVAQESPLLTTREAAEVLNVSPLTIRRMVARGDLPALRIGFGPKAQLRIDADELGRTLARASARA